MKDKIMNFPLIRFIINLRICQWAANNPVLSRFCNYEVISYLVCGVLTTIVSYVSYFLVRSLDFSMYLLGARCCICLRQQQDFCFPVR